MLSYGKTLETPKVQLGYFKKLYSVPGGVPFRQGDSQHLFSPYSIAYPTIDLFSFRSLHVDWHH
jgi:hypothetical protein